MSAMGLFKKRTKTEAATTGHAGDHDVLSQLEGMGTDLSKPRLWEHFIYCDDEKGAARLEAAAVEAGWTVQRVVPEYHGIVASRSDLAVTPDEVKSAREFFEALARSVPGGDYDGWGAEGD